MMISFDRYIDGQEGAPGALVGSLTAALAAAETQPLVEATGYAVLRSGAVLDWRDRLSRPTRRHGYVTLDDPESFVAHVARFGTTDTLLYASIADGRVTAVFNDHPVADENIDPADVDAGHRDDLAVMQLRTAEDWHTIVSNNGRLLPQRQFAELIEEIAHCVTDPDSATMLEVASTLSVRQNIDFGSRVRTQSGDVEFRFEQTSDASAGRGRTVEIPSTIAFTTNPWVGTAPVTVTARLRFRATSEGCSMGYKLIKLGDATEAAFRDIVVEINAEEVAPAVLFGNPNVGGSYR